MRLRERYAAALVRLDRVEDAIAQWREILDLSPGQRQLRERFLDLLQVAKRWELAARECRALLELHPDDTALILRLARLEHQRGEADAAVKLVRRFLSAAPAEFGGFRQAARILADFEALGEAEAVLREAVSKFPDEPAARELLAEHLFDAENSEEAVRIHVSLAAEADSAERAVKSAQILSNRKFPAEAVEILTLREADFPRNPGLLRQLADSARLAGQNALAFEKSRQILDLVTTIGEFEPALVRAAQIARADLEFRAAEAEFSDSPGQQALRAELLAFAGDRESAAQILAAMETSSDALTRKLGLLQKSRQQRRNRAWAEAAKTLETLLAESGERRVFWISQIVGLHRQAKNWDEALKWTQVWKEALPGQISVWRAEADILKKMGDFAGAAKVLQAASRQFEGDASLLAELGQLYLETDQHEAAEPIFWQIYDAEESATRRLRTVGKLLEVSRRLRGGREALIRRFQQRREGNRRSIGPVLALAEIARLSSDPDEQAKLLAEASILEPQNAALRLQIAGLQEAAGQWDAAIATLRELPASASQSASRRIAELLLMAGDFAEMADFVAQRLESGQMSPDAAKQMMLVLGNLGEFAAAEPIFDALVAQSPDSATLHFTGGVLAAYQGEFDRAIPQFFATIRLTQNLAGVWENSPFPDDYPLDAPPGTHLLAEVFKRSAQNQPVVAGAPVYRPDSRQAGDICSPCGLKAADDVAATHLALGHLEDIAKTLQPGNRAALAEEMRAAGVPTAVTRAVEAALWEAEALHAKFPQDDDILAWMLMSGSKAIPPPEEVVARLGHTHPELTATWLSLRIKWGKDRIPLSAMEDLVLPLLLRIERPSEPGLSRILEAFSTFQGEARAALRRRIVDWTRAGGDSSEAGFGFLDEAGRRGGPGRFDRDFGA